MGFLKRIGKRVAGIARRVKLPLQEARDYAKPMEEARRPAAPVRQDEGSLAHRLARAQATPAAADNLNRDELHAQLAGAKVFKDHAGRPVVTLAREEPIGEHDFPRDAGDRPVRTERNSHKGR